MRRVSFLPAGTVPQPQYTNWAQFAIETSNPALPTADNVIGLALENGLRQEYLQAAVVPPMLRGTETEQSPVFAHVLWGGLAAAGAWGIATLADKRNAGIWALYGGLGGLIASAMAVQLAAPKRA